MNLEAQLHKHNLRRGWATIMDRLYEQKTKLPCGASTRFGAGQWRMEVAFRTWEDHFTVWLEDQVISTFTLDFKGEIQVSFCSL
jgi:hypothetical protein